MEKLDAALPDRADIRNDPTYKELRSYRKINHFNVVTSSLPAKLSNAADFSRSSIEARIKAGHDDAVRQGIGRIDAPGLRSGITAPNDPTQAAVA